MIYQSFVFTCFLCQEKKILNSVDFFSFFLILPVHFYKIQNTESLVSKPLKVSTNSEQRANALQNGITERRAG